MPVFEELFIYACPKFIAANPPPYHEPELLPLYIQEPPADPAQRHLSLFLADVKSVSSVPTLRSFLKLYKSLDTRKVADLWFGQSAATEVELSDSEKEELVVQQMMVLKQSSRSVSKGSEGSSNVPLPGAGALMSGSIINTSDLDFVIDEVSRGSFWVVVYLFTIISIKNMVHIVESTIGRRYGGWFIRNTEHAQRVLDNIRSSPLPIRPNTASSQPPASVPSAISTKPKVAWGAVTVQS